MQQDLFHQFSNQYQQWSWEALCDYEAGIVNKSSVNYAVKKKPTLKFLNSSNQIYNVGFTIIEYLILTYGKDKLPQLIKSYGDVEKVLGVSEQEFESNWYKFVEEKY